MLGGLQELWAPPVYEEAEVIKILADIVPQAASVLHDC